MTVRILLGDCRRLLADLPAESVHCCVTSPPYWSLRDYGNPPSVWGGDPACEHEWLVVRRPGQTGGGGKTSTLNARYGEGGAFAPDGKANPQTAKTLESAFCTRCNAWLGCLGLEPTPELFIAHLVEVFDAVRRVLRDDGNCWINIADSYNGSGGAGGDYGPNGSKAGQPKFPGRRVASLKPKDLALIPERLAIALQDAGWWIRSRICWAKKACMPESVVDRPTSAWEHIWLLSKQAKYYFDLEAVRGLNRTEWIGDPGVVEGPDLPNEGLVLSDHLWTQNGAPANRPWTPTSVVDARRFFNHCVEAASALLQLAETKYQFGLLSLDAKVREKSPDDGDCTPISGLPVVERAASLATAFLQSDISPKAFAQEVQRLSATLPDSDVFGIRSIVAKIADSPCIRRDADTAVGIDNAGKIRQHELLVHLSASSPNHSMSGHTLSRPGAQLRNFWLLSPEPNGLPHFATFPTEIPRRCILAGSPERCCPTCGKGWVRQVEAHFENPGNRTTNGPRSLANRDMTAGFPVRLEKHVETVGWRPACPCEQNDGSGRAVVLDPFGGAGTVGLVADRLGRDAILCELNENYVSLAESRIRQDAPLFAEVQP